MKSGVRALGIAESFTGDRSTLAGVVVRASRVVDGFSFGSCTVGGLDVTDAMVDVYEQLDREDVRYIIVAGVALAWYNVLDMERVHEETGLPVIAVSFEASDGLGAAIEREFSGDAATRRRERYEALPERRPLEVNGERVFVRSVGLDDADADEVVRAFTPEGGRPEPVRVARLAARAGDRFVDETTDP